MRLVVIGDSAAGMSAALRARETPDWHDLVASGRVRDAVIVGSGYIGLDGWHAAGHGGRS